MLAYPFRTLTVLRKPHLAILWIAQIFSAMGDRIQEIAIVWLSIELIGSNAGYVLAAGSLSRLAFGLLGGVYADRWNRHKTMVGADLLRAIAVLTLPLAWIVADISLVHVTIVVAIVGGLTALFEPALYASLPGLAGDAQNLQATNGLMDITSRLAFIFGPGLAGLLIAILPLSHFFTVDAITFFISALAILSIGQAFTTQLQAQTQSADGSSIFADIHLALDLIRKNQPLFWSLAGLVIINMLWGASFTVGAALLVDQKFQAGVGLYSLIVAAYGLGNVLSNLVVGSLTISLSHRIRLLFSGVFVLGFGFLIVAFSPNISLLLAGAAFAALGGPMTDIMLLLIIQQDFPPDQVGKVYSVRMTLSNAGLSLGLVLAGPLFAFFDPAVGIAICAGFMIGISLLGLTEFWHRKI